MLSKNWHVLLGHLIWSIHSWNAWVKFRIEVLSFLYRNSPVHIVAVGHFRRDVIRWWLACNNYSLVMGCSLQALFTFGFSTTPCSLTAVCNSYSYVMRCRLCSRLRFSTTPCTLTITCISYSCVMRCRLCSRLRFSTTPCTLTITCNSYSRVVRCRLCSPSASVQRHAPNCCMQQLLLCHPLQALVTFTFQYNTMHTNATVPRVLCVVGFIHFCVSVQRHAHYLLHATFSLVLCVVGFVHLALHYSAMQTKCYMQQSLLCYALQVLVTLALQSGVSV